VELILNDIQEYKPSSTGFVQPKERNRSMFFNIPTRIILNGAGVSFFVSHNRFLHRFETSDGAEFFGFRLERVNYSWLKKLFLKGYLEKVEIQVKDISQNNQFLGDAIKMVFFAMYRRRISLSVMENIYESPMLRAWNRANPRKQIRPGARISEKSLRDLLQTMPDKVTDIQNRLLEFVLAKLPQVEPATDGEDRRRLHNFIRELIAETDPLIFFVLVGSRNEDKENLLRNISQQISQYVKHIDILDLASLLGIELVSAAERSALVRLMGGRQDIRSYLESPERRQGLMAEKKFRGSTVVVAVSKEILAEKHRLRFRFSVYNDGADVDMERKLMEDFTERSYSFSSGQALDEFFKTSHQNMPMVYEDNGLCFYYLTILQEQCAKNHINLETHIQASTSGKSVVTTLRFGF
jgi:hypothetical protein